YAGETGPHCSACGRPSVDPRVCGRNRFGLSSNGNHHGRSPRMRGKLLDGRPYRITGRSIPAYAGETGMGHVCRYHRTVDPRVCGGNWAATASIGANLGRSPRMRGKPIQDVRAGPAAGSIPAYAGETAPEIWRA